jgi:microbial collagenase
MASAGTSHRPARGDDGPLTGWSWDFGDGSVSSDRQPTHAYTSDGTFQVGLVVTDDQGAAARSTRTVTIVASTAEAGS